MKILIIGTGAEIPPTGWGAVESIITEHLKRLPRPGVEVDLINTLDWYSLVGMAKELNKKFDFVHFHYDLQWPFAKAMSSLFTTAMSSHFPYIGNEAMYSHYGYWKVMSYLTDNQHPNLNFCISQKDINYFMSKGVDPKRIYRLRLGASEDIVLKQNPLKPERSLYLGKVSVRKRQGLYKDIECIDFAGNLEDSNSAEGMKNYVGEWTRDQVQNELSDYGNLVLLSDGENTPLVVREALIAGIGVVVSESCIEELNTDMPFIEVVPNDKLLDIDYVKNVIESNREVSLKMKSDIREYGVTKFGWDACTNDYLEEIRKVVRSQE